MISFFFVFCFLFFFVFFVFQAEDGIRDLVRSRGLGDVYKRQPQDTSPTGTLSSQPVERQSNLRLPSNVSENEPGRIGDRTESKTQNGGAW